MTGPNGQPFPDLATDYRQDIVDKLKQSPGDKIDMTLDASMV
jgi:hypothetical protein